MFFWLFLFYNFANWFKWSLSKSSLKFLKTNSRLSIVIVSVFPISYIFNVFKNPNHDLAPLFTNFSLSIKILLDGCLIHIVSCMSNFLYIAELTWIFMLLPFCLWSFLGLFDIYSLSSVPKGDTLDP